MSFSLTSFLDRFLCPLLEGQTVFVSRPIGPRVLAQRETPALPADRLARFLSARLILARSLLPEIEPGVLSSDDMRIGLVLHNLLALGHPRYLAPDGAEGARATRVRTLLLEATVYTARLGPPPNAESAVRRHVLLSAFERLRRPEHRLSYWLGQRVFVGRPVPPRLRMWAGLRRVRVVTVERNWLKEVGLPAGVSAVWEALQDAAPLASTLESAHPDLDWRRASDVLRFAQLARLVASRALEQGLARAGEAYARALLHYAERLDTDTPDRPGRLQGGLRFLGYLLWLSRMCPAQPSGTPGPLCAALLQAAWRREPELILPDELGAGGVAGLRWQKERAVLEALVSALQGPAERVSGTEAAACLRIVSQAASRKHVANRIG